MPQHDQPEAWTERLLSELTISERALREFSKLNPDVAWLASSEVLRSRLARGKPRRRFERGQPRIELVDGRSVPLNYIDVVMRGRQVAVIRKDKLGENVVKTVRSVGTVRNVDPEWGRRKTRHLTRRRVRRAA
ncbi:hypothetical protein [Baekduia sp.]|uniref:hypothetical protein n=1 Tax=Baekduia sp. TaxID=2600305 RepID=UPI002D771C8E|nr:hypothetical protein [Baekduia sp.]